MTNPDLTTGTAEATVTHVFDAPRDLVWTVWTDPTHAAQWWGPAGFTTPVFESDLRPGGALVRHLRAPDGTVYPSTGIYEVVEPPNRLVTAGQIGRPGDPPFGIRTSVVFEERDGKTIVTVHQSYWDMTADAAAVAAENAVAGWAQSAERLDAYLHSLTDAKR